MLHAMWIVDSAYGYLKSTFAKAALFKIVTNTLLWREAKRKHNKYSDGSEGKFISKLTSPSKPPARIAAHCQELHRWP